jgi:hypothetical protein
MEFHISGAIRKRLDLDDLLFSFTGNVVFANVAASRKLAQRLNEIEHADADPARAINAGALFAMGLIDELSHALVARYRREVDPQVLAHALQTFAQQVTPVELERMLLTFTQQFPNSAIYRGDLTPQQWLAQITEDLPNREAAFEELMLLWLANSNPAFKPFHILFEDRTLQQQTAYPSVTAALPAYFADRPPVGPGLGSLIDVLRAPFLASPDSLTGQLDYIRENWSVVLGEDLRRVLLAIDVLREEEVAIWMRFNPARPDFYRHAAPGFGGEGFVGDEFVGFEDEYVTGPDGVRRRRYATDYQAPLNEYEAFSADQAWMPNVVLIAKSTYVWLEQLSKHYQRPITRLDQIPDAELKILADRGITGLWLIGLWERSRASKTIKRLRGNPDAVASAYSLKDYSIAEDLGGEPAYEDLRLRAARAGLRLASDMVPNHMGIDSDWVIEHPEWFLSRWESPFPVYTFNGPDLSTDPRVEIRLEDHYYDQTDAAVVFELRHHREGNTRYVYHGNDGTTFAWNDTAQLDYSKAAVREHVIQVILDVARRFPIIRFDAAMVLAKRHVQRLWFPLPGAGGSIPSRAEDAMSEESFDAMMPHEFWREVVDRVAVEVPGTLLLAEAFWLLEGYFVRTLGMHRVYNSAFMNMLRDEENAKYRSYLKKTVEFDPDILKRYVNFMSNPDERTAVDQFGSGDKYFGCSVLLATLPGLPMFGHGQVEGFTERYGMDFKQARLQEVPNEGLIARHQQLIAPLLKNRQLFAESTNFVMYDFWTAQGTVDENVFAYSNRYGDQRAIIFYNNAYQSTSGTIHMSVGFLDKATGNLQQKSLSEGLGLPWDDSIIIAYRDAVLGLEYLRRPSHFREHGLALDLRGYQHVALLNWRELHSTATQPWDRLCDALHGTGVYSVDEELSRLRLRPLVDAFKQVITLPNILAFVNRSSQILAERDVASPADQLEHNVIAESDAVTLAPAVPDPFAANGTQEETLPSDPTPVDPPSTPEEFVPSEEPDSELLAAVAEISEMENFIAKAKVFADKTAEFSGYELTPDQPEDEILPVLSEAAAELPLLISGFPESFRFAAAAILPTGDPGIPHEQVWAPLLAWISLQAMPTDASPLAIFDELRLRHAMAETFSSIGLEGDPAWRAAAQVRVLLKLEDLDEADAIYSPILWQDADVQWLAGVSSAASPKYLNKERFESLVCWLQTPAMLDFLIGGDPDDEDEADIAEIAEELFDLAAQSSYLLETFLAELTALAEEATELLVAERSNS